MTKFIQFVFVTLILALTVVSLAAQGRSKTSVRPPVPRSITVLDVGTFQGNTYANKFLGIKFDAPETWDIQGAALSAEVIKFGQSQISGKTAQMQKAIDDVPQKTKVLALFKKTIGSAAGANFICSAEILNNPIIVSNGTDFLRAVILGFKSSKLPAGFMFSEEIKQDKLEKITLPYFETSIGAVKQRYYGIVRKGYGIAFIMSYIDEKDFETMRNILANAEFSYK